MAKKKSSGKATSVAVDRGTFLAALESVCSGLAKKEIVEQSNHFVFREGRIQTLNDEVFCSIESPVEFEGAVPSVPLLGLLRKIPSDKVNLKTEKDNLVLWSQKKRGKIRVDSEIKLPVSEVELPEEWKELPKGFGDVIKAVAPCAGKDSSKFILTCVSITPEWVEASDNYQICRCKQGLEVDPCVIRAESIMSLVGTDVSEYAQTENWLHFRNERDVMISCRRVMKNYPSDRITEYVKAAKGKKFVLPDSIGESVDTCRLFAEDSLGRVYVNVRIKEGEMLLSGEGAYGEYKELHEIEYSAAPLGFRIHPDLLIELSRRKGTCFVSEKNVRVQSKLYIYMTCTYTEE